MQEMDYALSNMKKLRIKALAYSAVPFLWGASAIEGMSNLRHISQLPRTDDLTFAQKALEISSANEIWTSFAFISFIVWLIAAKRRTRKVSADKQKKRLHRVVLGVLSAGILYIKFVMNDIDRLASIPATSKMQHSDWKGNKRSTVGTAWFVVFLVSAYVSSKSAQLGTGINYVTGNLSLISAPDKYIFKYIDPKLITDALDKYWNYGGVAAASTEILKIFTGVLGFLYLNKVNKAMKSNGHLPKIYGVRA